MADFNNSDTASWDAGQVRRESPRPPARPPQKKRRRKRRRMNPLLFILLHLIFVALASALLGCAGWLLFSDFCSFNRSGVLTMEAVVEVSADDTVDTVADKLKNAGLIEYTWFFKLYANITGEEKIGMGSYTLNTDMDYHALVLGMRSAAGNMTAETVAVTIPEGYTVAQTIAVLAKNGVNTEAALTAAAQTADFDYPFIDNASEDISRLEGYLFPDTYEFYMGGGENEAVQVLNKMILRFDQQFPDSMRQKAADMGYSVHQLVTIASLIEKETDGADQTAVASVIYNRLERPTDETVGFLNIDASLVYAAGRPITQDDYQTLDSPYNTYLNKGLPPGPIASPGMVSLNSALNPQSTNYYYYAVGDDNLHHYFRTNSEFRNYLATLEHSNG